MSADVMTPSAVAGAEEQRYLASQWRLFWWKFREHKLARASLWVLVVLYLMAALCEIIAPSNPNRRDVHHKLASPQLIHVWRDGGLHWPFVYPQIRHVNPVTLALSYTADRARPLPIELFCKGDRYRFWDLIPMDRHLIGLPDGQHLYLMGADRLGRDLFSRIVYGSRISLTIGLIGVGLSLILGILIGGVSGYYGGMLDNLIQRTIEIIRSFPTIPLWLALSAAMPAEWSNLTVYFCMTVILALVGWTGIARVVRGKILALREEDYVLAAKVAGARESTIIFRHLIPGFASHLIVTATLAVPGMILAETSLSFLRLGLRPPTISWGVLLQDAQSISAIALYPWLLFPIGFVVVTVLMFNFFGDGLRDAADPYSH